MTVRGLGSTLALFGLSCFGLTTFPCLDATHFGGSQSGEFLLVRFQVCIQSGKAISPKKSARTKHQSQTQTYSYEATSSSKRSCGMYCETKSHAAFKWPAEEHTVTKSQPIRTMSRIHTFQKSLMFLFHETFLSKTAHYSLRTL